MATRFWPDFERVDAKYSSIAVQSKTGIVTCTGAVVNVAPHPLPRVTMRCGGREKGREPTAKSGAICQDNGRPEG